MGIWDRLFGSRREAKGHGDAEFDDPSFAASETARESSYTDEPAADEMVPPLRLDSVGRLVDPRNEKLATNLAKWRYWDQVGIVRPSIVGEQYRDGLRRNDPDLQSGRQLQLVAERDNPHDLNALAVVTQSGVAVGYIKKGLTPRVRKRQQESSEGIALVARGVFEGETHLQVRAFLIRPGRIANVSVEPNPPLGEHQPQPRT